MTRYRIELVPVFLLAGCCTPTAALSPDRPNQGHDFVATFPTGTHKVSMRSYPELTLLWELENHGSTAEYLDYGVVPVGMRQTLPLDGARPKKLSPGQIIVVEIFVSGMWSRGRAATSWFKWNGEQFELTPIQAETQPKKGMNDCRARSNKLTSDPSVTVYASPPSFSFLCA